MPPQVPLAAVVLVGGASRRMGRDKATMPHPAHPELTMVEHTVAVLAARCAPVIVVAAPGQPLPALSAEIIHDRLRGTGPLPATGRGLRAAAAAGVQSAFVAAVDMPNLSVGLVDQLLAHLARHRDADVVLPWDGRDHYLAGIYRTDLADRIDALVASGQRSMRAVADTVSTRRVIVEPAAELHNMNSPL
ncbi:MAG: molybdenum cofactor guanylyltransferase [Mycobacterium sp.]|nr:molybdenum cofactor guanylyltransferase [Mycobacterium sp.]